MDFGLPTFTWFWLYIPMGLLILFSIITYFTDERGD